VIHQQFGGTCSLHLQVRRVDSMGGMVWTMEAKTGIGASVKPMGSGSPKKVLVQRETGVGL
jgi:hypothetical protein